LLDAHEWLPITLTYQMHPKGYFDGSGTCGTTHGAIGPHRYQSRARYESTDLGRPAKRQGSGRPDCRAPARRKRLPSSEALFDHPDLSSKA
jgi:hypothetical protein